MRNGNATRPAAADAEAIVATVEAIVRTLMPLGYPSVSRTAAALQLSTRTLQRRLQAAGVSYKDLVEQVRFEAARHLLEESDMPLHEIAGVLGYSEAASLSRLVARRTGMPPRTLRKRHAR